MSSPLAIEIEAAAELSVAMLENSVPLVAQLSLTNLTELPLDNLTVEIALLPDFGEKWTTHISAIPVGGTFRIGDIELRLDRGRLVNQLERSKAELAMWVRTAPEGPAIASLTRDVDVLAYNEWSPLSIPPLLAAYVQPNHPAVAELLTQARTTVERLTGSPALDGYQSGSVSRVTAIVRAIYESLGARDITYSNPPASFEDVGQKIRTPDQILTERLATCLDVSVLIAACLEQVGLHPLIVIVRGHAFPAVWLEDDYEADGYVDDQAVLGKQVDLGRLLVFDSSAAVTRPAVAFDEARRRAKRALAEAPMRHAVDIEGARKLHYRPLPMRLGAGFTAAPEPIVIGVPATGPTAAPRSGRVEPSGWSRTSGRTRHPRIEAWKQRLLDTSLHNRLLNYRDLAQTLQLLATDLGATEDALASGEELELHARRGMLAGDDPRSKRLLDARMGDDTTAAFLRERLGRGELYCALDPDKMTTKLTGIYRAARAAIEETGSNPLCVTFGMLEWYESETSDKVRRAPLLLLPVELARNARANSFTLKATGEDARLNVTLFEKLRIDHGITVPELEDIPLDDSGVDVPAILHAAREAILRLPRWQIRDELHLGLFSFANFQLWKDLDQHADLLLQSPILQHVLAGKGDAFPNAGAFPEPGELDTRFAVNDLLCPLDADASQLAAVAAAADGKTFVLQGPPGTGKSQTITNLIAHAIGLGKRVLFVAEKSAALDVVQRRLNAIGLGPYVLELHSHKAGKQQVFDQFRTAIASPSTAEPKQWDSGGRKLTELRRELNGYVEALHRVRGGELSVFQVLGRLDQLRDARAYTVPASCLAAPERFDQLRDHAERLATAMTGLAPITRCAWQGCRIDTWQLDLPSRAIAAIEHALGQLDRARDAGARLAVQLEANAPVTPDDIDRLLQIEATLDSSPPHGDALHDAARWPALEADATQLVSLAATRSQALARTRARYGDGIFALDLDDLFAQFQRLGQAFFLVAWWGLRGARKALRRVATGRLPANAELTDDLAQARAVRDTAAALTERAALGREVFGDGWQGIASDPDVLQRALTWAAQLRQIFREARPGLLGGCVRPTVDHADAARAARATQAELRTSLQALGQLVGFDLARDAVAPDAWQALRHRIAGWRAALGQLRTWHEHLAAAAALSAAGCAPLVEATVRGELAPEHVVPSLEHSAYCAWLQQAIASDPVLAMFDGDRQHRHITMFRNLDHDHLALAAATTRARVSQRRPAETAQAGHGEMGFLNRQLQLKRPRLSIRKLLAEIPAVAARLKPVFLMSPMSVATYLDLKSTPFDLIVFDEASQIPTHQAIGVLARGRSAVVVGDSKQLPPTSFFASGGGGDDEPPDEDKFEELESILDECIAAGFPERRLDWHYRSRHESLIAFSNHYYYKNRLNTFPSALERGGSRGVQLHRVDGSYDKGGARTNQAEAQAVVAALVARLRAPAAKRRTYGIVTFSQAQQKLVEDLLDRAQRDYPEIEPFFDKNLAEPVIVKNLENIQGDERDVIIFSICYGPDQTGKPSMNFGPLNRDGGERRLNVAITRAREELVVYATLRPEHIDLTRTKAVGVKHLKTFLDYAARGPAAIAEALTIASDDAFESPFEQQVCERLRALGHRVDTQVGTAGYRLDLAVHHPDHPGRYLLAVECDGAHYHSARSARERDRLRETVLRGLGWRIHRVWSTDWWQTPDREVQRIVVAIEEARTQPIEAPPPPPPPAVPIALEAAPASDAGSKPTRRGKRKPTELSIDEVADAVAAVLRDSIAVPHAELIKLTARALGAARTTTAIAEHVASGISLLIRRGRARQDGDKVVLAS